MALRTFLCHPECWAVELEDDTELCAGAKCFGGMTPSCGSDCSGAPLLPIAYVAMNLLFNISALLVLRTSGEAGFRAPVPRTSAEHFCLAWCGRQQ